MSDIMNAVLLAAALIFNIFIWIRMLRNKNCEVVWNKQAGILKSSKAYELALFLIICIALFIRLYRFAQVPGGMNQDSAMAAVDAKALAEYGTDRFGMRYPVHLTAWGTSQMSSLLSYLMIPFIKLLGFSVFSVSLPQLLASLLGLLFLYLLIRDVFGKDAALVVLFFGAICPWHILQSRWPLDCNLFPHFLIAAVYFLYLSVRKEAVRIRYLFLSMFLFGLSMYCYGVSIYTVPLFLLGACIYLLCIKKVTFRDVCLAFLAYMLIAWPFIACMAINFLKINTITTPFFTIPYFADSVRASDILFFSENIGVQLLANIRSLLTATVLQGSDLLWNNMEIFGSMYLFSMPFAFTGLFALLRYRRKNTGAVLIVLFLMVGIWCGLITNNVNINRVNIIYYPIMILVGIGIYVSVFLLPGCLIQCVTGMIYTAAFAHLAIVYFTTYAVAVGQTFYEDFAAALLSIKDEKYTCYYITADTQSEGTAEVSEILTMFWLEIDAQYYQGITLSEDDMLYSEKYIYESMENITIDPDENAVYIVCEDDLQYFDMDVYLFEQYGSYYVVKKDY
ncbi:MAG: glycosyltransferase family 39 protein [Lachnospiraceae bacterium]|nr:glycosyltransferase family 39 protein [Lachnospiraceae bacterium]